MNSKYSQLSLIEILTQDTFFKPENPREIPNATVDGRKGATLSVQNFTSESSEFLRLIYLLAPLPFVLGNALFWLFPSTVLRFKVPSAYTVGVNISRSANLASQV